MYILSRRYCNFFYISHLSQENRAEVYVHSCRYCLRFTRITRDGRKRYVHCLHFTLITREGRSMSILVLFTFHTYHKRREKRMYILVCILYISYLSQGETGRRYVHSCRYCLHFTLITREERDDMSILVGTVYISHLSQEKRGEYM